ncbi:lipase 3-like, partial [Musca vetustissima]|uniref:lipase 3-like n=1 Tax=Musca vetustissima TaxID=27455 RepID=UPI002AB68549
MKFYWTLSIFLLIILILNDRQKRKTKCDLITDHGYPCEEHTVLTADGYLLTMFRIPYSPVAQNKNIPNKPPVLLMHCLFCSSDIFLLNGPDNGLPFMLTDYGYDVWLGNVRGNIYSQRHVARSPWSLAFWNFTLNELGRYDLAAKIDYITTQTAQPNLHYVGYSQGTALFAILLSEMPEYGEKIKTTHFLSQCAFLCHLKSLPILSRAVVLARPAMSWMGIFSSHLVDRFLNTIAPPICKLFETPCIMILNFVAGWDSPYFNRTLLGDFLRATPAVAGNLQTMHFFQSIIYCEFRKYDFGHRGNLKRYGQPQPPSYKLEKIHLETPINIFYADNDYFVSLKDVQHMFQILGNRTKLYRVQYPKYNHFDLVLATNVKEVINDCIVDKIQEYERRSFN